MRNQKGFTLIELIIVIVVLGILAVTAAPQFVNFSSDARTAAVEGMEASVKGASQLVHAKALISPDANAVNLGDAGWVAVTSNGYGDTKEASGGDGSGDSEANAGDFTTALDMSDWGAVVATADVGNVSKGDLLIYPSDVSVTAAVAPDTQCYVYYRLNASSAPTINSVTEGCE